MYTSFVTGFWNKITRSQSCTCMTLIKAYHIQPRLQACSSLYMKNVYSYIFECKAHKTMLAELIVRNIKYLHFSYHECKHIAKVTEII